MSDVLKRKHSHLLSKKMEFISSRIPPERGSWLMKIVGNVGVGFLASGSCDRELIFSLWKTFFHL